MTSSRAAEHFTTSATAPARAVRHRVPVLGIVAGVARSRAAWVFAAAWLGSALVLVVSGLGFPFFSLLSGVGYLLLSLLTVALTRAAPAAPAAPAERPRLWRQVGVFLPFVALTAWGGLAFHRVVAPDAAIPLWSPLVAALERLGVRGSATATTSPTR